MLDTEDAIKGFMQIAGRTETLMSELSRSVKKIADGTDKMDLVDDEVKESLAQVCAKWACLAASVAHTAYDYDDVYTLMVRKDPITARPFGLVLSELQVKLEALSAEPIAMIHNFEKRGVTGPSGERLRSWIFESVEEKYQAAFGRLIYAVS